MLRCRTDSDNDLQHLKFRQQLLMPTILSTFCLHVIPRSPCSSRCGHAFDPVTWRLAAHPINCTSNRRAILLHRIRGLCALSLLRGLLIHVTFCSRANSIELADVVGASCLKLGIVPWFRIPTPTSRDLVCGVLLCNLILFFVLIGTIFTALINLDR